MGHLKRQEIPKNWVIPKKGKTFVVKPISKKGIPLLILLRENLKVVANRKELKKAINMKSILINNRVVKDERIGVGLFDTISLIPSKTNYKVIFTKKGKFSLEKIKENEINEKIVKISGKKILKGKKIQLNLIDGNNFLSEIKCNVNDSVLLKFKEKKIEKCLPLKDGAKVIIFAGKHSGESGKIEKINNERKMVSVDNGDKKLNILIKQLMVIE